MTPDKEKIEEQKPQGEPQKSRIETVEENVTLLTEAVLTLTDKLEQIANKLGTIEKTSVKKSTQRFGSDHTRRAAKDTKTGVVYPSLFACGKALAAEYEGLDPLDRQVYYKIKKADPERVVEVERDSPEAVKAFAEADAKLAAEVEASNKKLAAEEAAKAQEEAAKAQEEAAKAQEEAAKNKETPVKESGKPGAQQPNKKK